MDKSSEKKPIIPEINIPDMADYQPSDSVLARIVTRAYVFGRTSPRILAGSIFALALSVAGVVFISAPTSQNISLPPLADNLAPDIPLANKNEMIALNENTDPLNKAQNTLITNDNVFDDLADSEELKTSIKPLDLPETNDNTSNPSASGGEEKPAPENIVDQSEKVSRPIKSEDAEKNTPKSSAEISKIDFSKRFGEDIPSMTEDEAQKVLHDGLARVGSIEQSIGNLKTFPFDLVVKPETETTKFVLLKIAQGAEATSGFWREIEEQPETSVKGEKKPKQIREEHFLVVQAVDEKTDKPVEVEVKDMDSGKTEKKSSWAVLIPEKQFMDFAESKQEDGSFSQPILGRLNIETGEIEWEIDTDGRALVNWKEFDE